MARSNTAGLSSAHAYEADLNAWESDDYENPAIHIMESLMKERKYSLYLNELWQKWRVLYQSSKGASKDSEIPNQLYNYYRNLCYCTVFSFIGSYPHDIKAKSMDFGDKSWFYCYHDEVDPYRENAIDPIDSDEPFSSCYDTSVIYKVFDYLIIEENEMGAWQAYLLSNATILLPTTWHGGYIKRQYVFEAEDLHRKRFPILPFRPRIDFIDEYDVNPTINISGSEAVVSCCYWNEWEGLVREIVNINMNKGRFRFGFSKSKKVLYKYNCGIMF